MLNCTSESYVDQNKKVDFKIKNNLTEINNDFQSFYSTFRNALINYDLIQIKKMTKFPLEVWGFEDNDPHLRLNDDEFELYFKQSLYYSIDEDPTTRESISTFDLIKKNENVDSLIDFEKTNNFQHIGNLYFRKIDNTWKVEQIFADTKAR